MGNEDDLKNEVDSLRGQVRRLEEGLGDVRRSLADVERIANEALDEARGAKEAARHDLRRRSRLGVSTDRLRPGRDDD